MRIKFNYPEKIEISNEVATTHFECRPKGTSGKHRTTKMSNYFEAPDIRARLKLLLRSGPLIDPPRDYVWINRNTRSCSK